MLARTLIEFPKLKQATFKEFLCVFLKSKWVEPDYASSGSLLHDLPMIIMSFSCTYKSFFCCRLVCTQPKDQTLGQLLWHHDICCFPLAFICLGTSISSWLLISMRLVCTAVISVVVVFLVTRVLSLSISAGEGSPSPSGCTLKPVRASWKFFPVSCFLYEPIQSKPAFQWSHYFLGNWVMRWCVWKKWSKLHGIKGWAIVTYNLIWGTF